ncbi:hypothetical protein G6F56_007705 [Rhizopus delemar]|nr:hypothetical protein G6F56_007705 [Rhizopus delemar]
MLNYEQICKILSEDQEVIDIITKDLLNVYEDSYTLDSAQILANGSRKCLLISERSFGQGAPKDENLNELVALSMCLLQDEQIIATLGRSQNAAIQHLYDKYKAIFDPDCNNQL